MFKDNRPVNNFTTKTENGIWILALSFRSSDFVLKNVEGMLTVYTKYKIVNEVICTN